MEEAVGAWDDPQAPLAGVRAAAEVVAVAAVPEVAMAKAARSTQDNSRGQLADLRSCTSSSR